MPFDPCMDLLAAGYTRQGRFPLRDHPWWVPPDLAGYEPPDRSAPPIQAVDTGAPVVTVVGTVRDERIPLTRSLSVWAHQRLPTWLRAEYLVLDEGSTDWVREMVAGLQRGGAPIAYARLREPGDPRERSCTVAFNAALRRLVRTPLVIFQWWDRIPGGFDHLRLLVEPHTRHAGIATTVIPRHIGGSSSCHVLDASALAERLALVDWERDPHLLARIAGPTGGHCLPGRLTESAGLCVPTGELLALGGWDERYQDRASYVNVELWRRLLCSGLVAWSPPEPEGACYHQSHPCPMQREKTWGWLADPLVRRNQGEPWGQAEILEHLPAPA